MEVEQTKTVESKTVVKLSVEDVVRALNAYYSSHVEADIVPEDVDWCCNDNGDFEGCTITKVKVDKE